MSNDESAIIPSLLKEIDRMLRTTEAARETLHRLKTTLSNEHDPHFYTRDVDDLIALGSDMEFLACGLHHNLQAVKRPDKRKRRNKHKKVIS